MAKLPDTLKEMIAIAGEPFASAYAAGQREKDPVKREILFQKAIEHLKANDAWKKLEEEHLEELDKEHKKLAAEGKLESITLDPSYFHETAIKS